MSAAEVLEEIVAKIHEVEAKGFDVSGDIFVQDVTSVRDGRRRVDGAAWYSDDGPST